MTQHPPAARVLGLDIGGSSTRALLEEDGTEVAAASGPSASLTVAGRPAAEDVLDRVLAELASAAGGPLGPIAAICAGTSGSGAASAVDWLSDRVRALVALHLGNGRHQAPITVVNDARLVLAAHDLASGIALVAGTGSIAVGILDGAEAHAGGWGYLLGDEGSGYWVVREAIRELCRRHDRHQPPGALAEVFGDVPLTELLARFYETPAPGPWAALAPQVLDADDPAAATICDAAARTLARLAADVAATLRHPDPVPVIVAGGLGAGHPRLSASTVSAVLAQLPTARVVRATRPSVVGAVRLARELAARDQLARGPGA
jgi:glucosamine kinase